ncbi:MAG: ATP-binding cassette domain-containing protein [Deltaproteobacteria bacterium]|nr:ATP-binding cassette domain-containing protein [Deltaproteobacteria bacterium]
MNNAKEADVVLKLVDGIRFEAGPEIWTIDPTKVLGGTWIALVPGGAEPVVDPSGSLAWILATMNEPIRGTVELLGQDVYRLDYMMRQRLRSRIGFVHGYGGLISNRSVRENIALPVSIHSHLGPRDEEELVELSLRNLALEKVADLKPHEMDGGTRWRACLARALVLDPEWLVMEGLGNWEMDRGRGTGWRWFLDRQRAGGMASVICLPRQNPGFEAWFIEHDGIIVRYSRFEGAGQRNTTA